MQWLTKGFRQRRKYPGWFPTLANRTGRGAGALTVAGQWRSFTAFPSILAIAVMNWLTFAGTAAMAWNEFPHHEHL